jgi:uncharacterized protein YjbI with pentapeptide repeats
MKGEELVKKILAGERDFTGIKLEEGFDLSGYEGFKEMQDYISKHRHDLFPLSFYEAEMKGIKAPGLNLPYVWGTQVNLEHADLSNGSLAAAHFFGANLREANLRNTYLYNAMLGRADLYRANLEYADLHGASLIGTNLREACVAGANFLDANFRDAILRGVRGLEAARNLCAAHFFMTRVSEHEKIILDKAIQDRKFFELFE